MSVTVTVYTQSSELKFYIIIILKRCLSFLELLCSFYPWVHISLLRFTSLSSKTNFIFCFKWESEHRYCLEHWTTLHENLNINPSGFLRSTQQTRLFTINATRARARTHTHTHIYTQTHTRTHARTYTQTHTRAFIAYPFQLFQTASLAHIAILNTKIIG